MPGRIIIEDRDDDAEERTRAAAVDRLDLRQQIAFAQCHPYNEPRRLRFL